MSQTDQQFDDIVYKAREIFSVKTKDYGMAWRILRTQSLTDQIFIKAARIRSLEEKKESKIDESVDDEYLGIINYCIMAMIQLDKGSSIDNYDMDLDELYFLYDGFVKETKTLMLAKNHDYGEAWRDMRVSSMTDLILMKLLRIKQIEENEGQTIVSEGLKANYQDILNYAVFALIKLTEQQN